MPSSRLWFLILCALCAAGQETHWIPRYVEEVSAANKAWTAKDYAACRRRLTALLELVDGRADIVYRLAQTEAALGNRNDALKWLTLFSRMKLPFADPQTDPAFGDLRERHEFADVVSRLEAARQPVSHSERVLTLAEKDLISEDIAYDASGGRFYISSVRYGKILSVTRDGTTAEFLPAGAPNVWAILALRVDARRRYLWATTAAMPENRNYRQEDRGRSALLRFSLGDGALMKRYDLPRDAEHVLGDMTLSPSGDVFVSDSHGPVFWVAHGDDRLQVLVPAGTFRSPQTPALSPDGRLLFVPDYSRGISAVDLRSKGVHLLPHPPELSLAGIDGLYLTRQTMLAVQNGVSPARIIRLKLDTSLNRITGFEVLESNWAGLGVPTHGVVDGSRFYFIANSGWDRMTDDGQLKPGAVFESPTVRELRISGVQAGPM